MEDWNLLDVELEFAFLASSGLEALLSSNFGLISGLDAISD